MRPSVPDVHITEALDADLAAYRALAWQAVLGLFFGLLSPLAMLGPTLWAIPLLGVFFCYWAFRRIRKYAPAMVGRKIAWTGLTLSLLFAAAAPSEWLSYRWTVRNEARQFADTWFSFLTQDEPEKAHQWILPPNQRQPPNVRLWDFYRQAAKGREDLEKFTAMPVIRTLLALGPRAQTRFYDYADQLHEDGNDRVDLLYAVTYEESGERMSFFVLVGAYRTKLPGGGADWRVLNVQGGVRPEGFE
jgi:hypothetical protein